MEKHTISIRKATVNDAPIIALLARTTFTESFGHLFNDKNDLLNYYESTFSVTKITSSFKKENNVFWLAFVDDLPVGYAKLKRSSPNQLIDTKRSSQLQKIYVLSDFKNRTIGVQLKNAVLKEAKSFSNAIWLSTLADNNNLNVINFYKKNDFKPIGDFNFTIGKQQFLNLVMVKQF